MRIGDSLDNTASNLMDSNTTILTGKLNKPNKFEIDAYQNKVHLNKQVSRDSPDNLGYI